MTHLSPADNQVLFVTSFHHLISTPFIGEINAICWKRELAGDFSEIVDRVKLNENLETVSEQELNDLDLSEQGQLARAVLLNDMKLLRDHGASPTLNVIGNYDRDETNPFFPTDVYSFHVDRSPIPTATFLCTYYGEPSEILPNAQATRKILVPEIRARLREQYQGADEGFESFLSEHFYDLHFQAHPNASTINLGLGNLWKLSVDHPESKVLPCIHRAPIEKPGEKRLLMIC